MLKHEILRGYLAKFATATGTRSPGHRVGYIDGYAGPGSYTNEVTGVVTEGSPAIAIQEMRHQLALAEPRHLECFFVEKKPEYFESLKSLVDHARAEGLPAEALKGKVEDHLHKALGQFDGLPVLVFLDPFGASLPLESSIPLILQRPGTQPTELLLNFSVETLRRSGARIHEPVGAQGREANLTTMDKWLGGDWWRAFFIDPATVETTESAYEPAEKITDEYARRVAARTGCGVFPVDVRREAGHKPIFRLMLFHPRSLAAYKYNDAVSLAQEKWRDAMWAQDIFAADRFDPLEASLMREVAKADKEQFKLDTVSTIREQIRATLDHQPYVSVRNEFTKVFGEAAGLGREMHLRAAWDELTAEGVTQARDKSLKHLDAAVISRVTPPRQVSF
jgi:three-Cys-motif partner protein